VVDDVTEVFCYQGDGIERHEEDEVKEHHRTKAERRLIMASESRRDLLDRFESGERPTWGMVRDLVGNEHMAELVQRAIEDDWSYDATKKCVCVEWTGYDSNPLTGEIVGEWLESDSFEGLRKTLVESFVTGSIEEEDIATGLMMGLMDYVNQHEGFEANLLESFVDYGMNDMVKSLLEALKDEVGVDLDGLEHDARDALREAMTFDTNLDWWVGRTGLHVDLFVSIPSEWNREYTSTHDLFFLTRDVTPDQWVEEYICDCANESSLAWLARQQGYALEDLVYPTERSAESPFCRSARYAWDSLSSRSGQVTVLALMKLDELIRIAAGTRPTRSIEIDPSATDGQGILSVGFYNKWSGAGDCCCIDLERPVRLPLEMVSRVTTDERLYATNHLYSIKESNDLVEGCWSSGYVKASASAPDQVPPYTVDDIMRLRAARAGLDKRQERTVGGRQRII
jgi:hypothetical protein